MLYIYILCENDLDFVPCVTLEYAHHIVTWADFKLEITGFGSVMD